MQSRRVRLKIYSIPSRVQLVPLPRPILGLLILIPGLAPTSDRLILRSCPVYRLLLVPSLGCLVVVARLWGLPRHLILRLRPSTIRLPCRSRPSWVGSMFRSPTADSALVLLIPSSPTAGRGIKLRSTKGGTYARMGVARTRDWPRHYCRRRLWCAALLRTKKAPRLADIQPTWGLFCRWRATVPVPSFPADGDYPPTQRPDSPNSIPNRD